MTVPVVDIRHTLNELSARLELLPGERLAAAVRAINRTMTSSRAESARELSGEYPGLRIAELKARIKIVRATRANPSAALVFSGRRIRLFGKFGMRASGRWGARFSRLPWRLETISGETVTPEMLARAFRQRSRSGRADVYARSTSRRLSFEILVAPGIARALGERRVREAVVRGMRSRFAKTFEQEAKFRLSRR